MIQEYALLGIEKEPASKRWKSHIWRNNKQEQRNLAETAQTNRIKEATKTNDLKVRKLSLLGIKCYSSLELTNKAWNMHAVNRAYN